MDEPSLESLPAVPRRVKLKRPAIGVRIFIGLFLAVIAGVWIFRGAPAIALLHELKDSGEQIQASEVGSRVVAGKSSTYYLTVDFASGVDHVTQEQQVPPDLYSEYAGRPDVPVTFLADRPNDFVIGTVDQARIDHDLKVWLLPIAIGSCTALVFLMVSEISIYLDRRLLGRGEATIGVVTDVSLTTGRSTSTTVTFRYETALGEREKSCSCPGDLRASFVEGAKVIVLYRKDNDREAKPLGMFQMAQWA